MEKIKLVFECIPGLIPTHSTEVVLTLDEKGKNYSVNRQEFPIIFNVADKNNSQEQPVLPKRILNAFTERTIDKILSKDVIPTKEDICIFDGHNYVITITKGQITKEYTADDYSIDTYPLLRYLASWINK